MNSSVGIIGGADGPTAVFITGSSGWINPFGVTIVLLLLVPNIIYALRHRGEVNRCTSRLANLAESLGRYGCMLLMALNIGGRQFDFLSAAAALLYFFGTLALLLLYWLFWVLYAMRRTRPRTVMLALLPALLFLLSGATLRSWPLAALSLVFGAGHIYVTAQNHPKE